MKFDNNNNTEFEQPTPGTKPARLIGIYDIGVQPGKPFNGEPAKNQAKIVFTFELVGKEKQTDGSPFIKSKSITKSLHKKGNLVPILKALGLTIKSKNNDWYEAPSADLTTLLGEPVMLAIAATEDGKTYIASISAPMEGMTMAEPTEKLGYLDLDSDDYLDQFTKAPQWIQKKCQESIGWNDR